jgi:hypothetical protein
MANLRNAKAVIAMLKRAKAKHTEGLRRGLIQAGLYLQRESMKIVPVDYGNLKASAFVRADGNYIGAAGQTVAMPIDGPSPSSKFSVQVGYTAPYAIFVHENLDAVHGAAFNAKYAAQLAAAQNARRKRSGGTTGPFRHNRGENQQAKFLEGPFRRNQQTIKAIIAAEVGVK